MSPAEQVKREIQARRQGFRRSARTATCRGPSECRSKCLERFRHRVKIRRLARVTDVEIPRNSRRAVKDERDGPDYNEVDAIVDKRPDEDLVVRRHRRMVSSDAAARRIRSRRSVGVSFSDSSISVRSTPLSTRAMSAVLPTAPAGR